MKYDAEYIDALAGDVAAERARIEIELIGSILAGPAQGIAAAERAGVHRDLFNQDDLRAIYVAADYGRHRDVLTVLQYARFLLRHLGLWDEGDRRSFTRGMRWGNESLAALAESYPGPAAAACYARQLRRIGARQQQAGECYRRLIGLLAGTIEPVENPAQGNVTTVTTFTTALSGRENSYACN